MIDIKLIRENPELVKENIKNVAYQKALSVFNNHNDSIIIGADTVVCVDNEILLKPKDKDDARGSDLEECERF